jgi:hypothetical protein
MLDGVTPSDVSAIMAALLSKAKAGDIAAARLILDRLCGTDSLAEWPSDAQIRRTDWLNSVAGFGR